MNKLLTTTDLQDFTVTVIPEAYKLKDDALALSKGIVAVTTQQQQQDAIAAASMLKGLIKQMEATHEYFKRPILDAGRAVDGAKNKYNLELDAETKRLQKLAADYQAEENRKAAAIRAEQERQQREEREKEARALAEIAAKAEAERRANLAAIAAAKDEEARRLAQIKADKDAEERAEEVRINQEACREAERQRIEQLRTAVAEKPTAARVVVKMDYELKDIKALYAARPDLVELTPKRSLILAAISIPNHPAIPGIYEFESTAVQAKAS